MAQLVETDLIEGTRKPDSGIDVKDLVRDRSVSFDWEAKPVVIIHCWSHAS